MSPASHHARFRSTYKQKRSRMNPPNPPPFLRWPATNNCLQKKTQKKKKTNTHREYYITKCTPTALHTAVDGFFTRQ